MEKYLKHIISMYINFKLVDKISLYDEDNSYGSSHMVLVEALPIWSNDALNVVSSVDHGGGGHGVDEGAGEVGEDLCLVEGKEDEHDDEEPQ